MAGTLFSDAVIQFFVNTKQAESALDGFANKFDQGISRMRNMVIGFLGVKGLYGYYQTLEKIVSTADRWSIPVEKVSEFTNAFSQFGGTADEAADSIEKLQNLSNQLKFHSNGAFRELSAILGVNLQNKDFQGAIDALRKGMQGLNADAKAEVISMLGVNSTMARMLMAEDGVYNTAIKKSKEYGVITEDTAQKIRQLRQSMADIKQAFLEIAIPLMDIIKPIIGLIRDLVVWFGKLDPAIQKAIMIGAVLLKMTTSIKILTGLIPALTGGLAAFNLTAAGSVAVIAAFGPGLYDMATKLSDVINGTKDLSTALDELSQRKDAFGWILRKSQTIGERIADNLYEAKAMRSIRKINSGNYKTNDVSVALTHYENEFDRGNITEEEYNAKRKLYNDKYRGASDSPKPIMPDWYGKQSPVTDNRTINFNIYGVQGAQDLMSQMQTLVQNNIPPITYKTGN